VILKDEVGEKWLPIYIGPFEAQAIALQLEHIQMPRPLTHDLVKNILDALNVTISRVIICDLKDNTYYAKLVVKNDGVHQEIDSRPSDAIALALRMQAPILVAEDVMLKAGIAKAPEETPKTKKLKELQRQLRDAVEREAYEEAARIRDQIRILLNESPPKPTS
jgi:bifunctional DNase/RNase